MKDTLTAVTTFLVAVSGAWGPPQARPGEQAQSVVDASQRDHVRTIVDSVVAAEALRRGVPGVAVAVVQDASVLLQQGYGVADAESGRPVTKRTPFNIASTTKVFTAAVVQQLASEGRIKLDAPVRAYYEMPAIYRDITVRQLLTHTSGIARDLRLDNNDDPDATEYKRRLEASRPSASPGERFEYSNTGFTVLGWLVEAVEGQPLEEVFRRRIFRPLGLNDARYRASLADDPPRARPHEVVEGKAIPAPFVSGGFGSGGLSLSVADCAAFAVALQQGKFLPPDQLAAAWTPGRLASGKPAQVRLFSESDGYGLGWFVARFADRPVVAHGGAITGFSADLYHFPDERLTIAVLANAKRRDDGVPPAERVARTIAQRLVQSELPDQSRN